MVWQLTRAHENAHTRRIVSNCRGVAIATPLQYEYVTPSKFSELMKTISI